MNSDEILAGSGSGLICLSFMLRAVQISKRKRKFVKIHVVRNVCVRQGNAQAQQNVCTVIVLILLFFVFT